MLRNTFLNARKKIDGPKEEKKEEPQDLRKVHWIDTDVKSGPLVTIIPRNKSKPEKSGKKAGSEVKPIIKRENEYTGAEVKTPDKKPRIENCSATDFLEELEEIGESSVKQLERTNKKGKFLKKRPPQQLHLIFASEAGSSILLKGS